LLCLMNLGSPFIWVVLIPTIALVVVSFFVILNYRAQIANYPRRHKIWSETWRCLHCGNTFVEQPVALPGGLPA
jgi:hypothetical protein